MSKTKVEKSSSENQDNVTNKVLAVLMIAAIFVSLGGLFISLDRLNQLRFPSATGFASSLGRVNVTVGSTTAIDVIAGLIDFGVCAPPSTGLTEDSNNTQASGCTAPALPQAITIKNIGNVYVNVSAQSSLTGSNSNFIGGNNASLWLNSWNFTPTAQMTSGCLEKWTGCGDLGVGGACNCTNADPNNCTRTTNWTEVTSTAYKYVVCRNLSFETGTANVSVWMRIYIPSDAPVRANRNITMTFSAATIP